MSTSVAKATVFSAPPSSSAERERLPALRDFIIDRLVTGRQFACTVICVYIFNTYTPNKQVFQPFLRQFARRQRMRCPSIHVAFYLWYGTPEHDGRWIHWNHPTLPHWRDDVRQLYPVDEPFSPPDDVHSQYYPASGPYSSSDPEHTRAQMRSLALAGVDSAMLSWWGQTNASITRDSQGVDTDALIPHVLDAAAAAGVGISWHLEPYGGRSPRSILDDLRYLHARYGDHPALWKDESNRPLVFLCEQ